MSQEETPMKRIRIHLKRPQSACDYYRAVLPYRHLAKPLCAERVQLEVGYGVSLSEQIDAMVIQRIVPIDFLVMLLSMQAAGMRIAWDTDDDFLSIPPWSPLKLRDIDKAAFVAARVTANEVFCATEPIAKRLTTAFDGMRTNDVTILPNLVDLDDWGGGLDHPPCEDGRIRIVWAGSNTHDADLEMIEPALDKLLKQYPQIDLHVFGVCPAKWKATWWGRVTETPWVPLEKFAPTLAEIRPHIGLAPLVDHPFNKARSNLKWLEYTMVGAVTVASTIGPFPSRLANGIAYAARPESWVSTIEGLIEDEAVRRRMHEDSRQCVKAEWSWQSAARDKWLSAFRAFVE